MEISNRLNFEEWTEVYKKLTFWELKLGQLMDDGMNQVLKMQKDEATRCSVNSLNVITLNG